MPILQARKPTKLRPGRYFKYYHHARTVIYRYGIGHKQFIIRTEYTYEHQLCRINHSHRHVTLESPSIESSKSRLWVSHPRDSRRQESSILAVQNHWGWLFSSCTKLVENTKSIGTTSAVVGIYSALVLGRGFAPKRHHIMKPEHSTSFEEGATEEKAWNLDAKSRRHGCPL